MSPCHRMIDRRGFFAGCVAGAAIGQAGLWAMRAVAQEAPRDVFFERPAEGTPHKGKVLLAVQAHSDDIPLTASGTVAKLVKEGYTGYLVRATNDDMATRRDWERQGRWAITCWGTSATMPKSPACWG